MHSFILTAYLLISAMNPASDIDVKGNQIYFTPDDGITRVYTVQVVGEDTEASVEYRVEHALETQKAELEAQLTPSD